MRLQTILLLLMGMMLLATGKLSAQRVKTHYNRYANFAQYKTYSWEQVKTREPLEVERIKNAVNASLAAKGWTRVDSGGDVSIIATEITRTQQMHVSYGATTGGSGWVPGPGDSGDTETYKIDTLVIDLLDTKTRQLLWTGSSTDTLSKQLQQEPQESG